MGDGFSESASQKECSSAAVFLYADGVALTLSLLVICTGGTKKSQHKHKTLK
jgi:hypothetical protein